MCNLHISRKRGVSSCYRASAGRTMLEQIDRESGRLSRKAGSAAARARRTGAGRRARGQAALVIAMETGRHR